MYPTTIPTRACRRGGPPPPPPHPLVLDAQEPRAARMVPARSLHVVLNAHSATPFGVTMAPPPIHMAQEPHDQHHREPPVVPGIPQASVTLPALRTGPPWMTPWSPAAAAFPESLPMKSGLFLTSQISK
jgi:hypothetical protein